MAARVLLSQGSQRRFKEGEVGVLNDELGGQRGALLSHGKQPRGASYKAAVGVELVKSNGRVKQPEALSHKHSLRQEPSSLREYSLQSFTSRSPSTPLVEPCIGSLLRDAES